MDVVYILGTGSESADEELRYSVRSLFEHMADLRNVYVVGAEPSVVPGAIHVLAYDDFAEGWKNTYSKVRRACEIPELSDEFLLMNDDFFMLSPFVGADFPFYALKGSAGGSCGGNSFHVHAPMRIKKDWFLNMPFSLDQNACKSWRSFYANFYRAPFDLVDDFVLSVCEEEGCYDGQIAFWPCFSISDRTMQDSSFRSWLAEKYAQPSSLELE